LETRKHGGENQRKERGKGRVRHKARETERETERERERERAREREEARKKGRERERESEKRKRERQRKKERKRKRDYKRKRGRGRERECQCGTCCRGISSWRWSHHNESSEAKSARQSTDVRVCTCAESQPAFVIDTHVCVCDLHSHTFAYVTQCIRVRSLRS